MQGIYLPFLAMVLVAIFAVAALAIDTGKLQHRKIRLQRAVDAAAVVGADMLQRDPSDGNRDFIETTAKQIVIDNLRTMGESPPLPEEITVTFEEDLEDLEDGETLGVRVATTIDSEVLLFNAIPFFDFSPTVPASARAIIPTVGIILLLDKSGSMCGNSGGLEDPPVWDGANCNKLVQLKIAAKALVENLDPTKEHIAIIEYGNEAVWVRKMFDFFDVDDVNSKIDDITAPVNTDTNGAMALWLAYQELIDEDSGLNPARDVLAVVLIGDGAWMNAGDEGDPYLSVMSGCTVPDNTWTERRYEAANYWADKIRLEGVAVHAIMVGPKVENPYLYYGIPGDPYENAHLDKKSKRFAPARLTKNRRVMKGGGLPAEDGYDGSKYADPYSEAPLFNCGLNGRNRFEDIRGPAGNFLHTPDATELEYLLLELVGSIKKRIKLVE